MSRSRNARRTGSKKTHAQGGEGAGAVLIGCAVAAGIAVITAFAAALSFAAFGVRGEDPAKNAPVVALAALAGSSAAAGAAAARLGGIPTPVCAAVGAAISAIVLLISLVPALPTVSLPLPKVLCAAIPVLSSLLGAFIAAPKRRRRRRSR